jgi:hypothetical protein
MCETWSENVVLNSVQFGEFSRREFEFDKRKHWHQFAKAKWQHTEQRVWSLHVPKRYYVDLNNLF